MSSRVVRIVDLFCGIGGFSEGALRSERFEAQVALGIDLDAIAGETWRRNRPNSFFLNLDLSVSNLPVVWNETSKLGVERGNVDFLVASPPCQKFSSAGNRDNADPANLLFFSVLKAVERWRPTAVVLENVVRFFTAYDGAFVVAAQRFLRDEGYVSAWKVLDAADYGVPQVRRRGFLVAVDRDSARGKSLFPPPTHHAQLANGNQALIEGLQLARTPTVEEAIGDLPSLKAGEGDEPTLLKGQPKSMYQQFLRADSREVFNHLAWGHSAAMVDRIRFVKEGQAPQSEEQHPMKPKSYFRQAYARLHRGEPASTVTTNFHNPGSGRFIHYSDDRTITVREAARLQSFIDGFRFYGTRSQSGRHVGNAVPPLLARAVLENLVRYIGW